MTEIKHGYLVLADISGYTGYLAQVELEHAHEILTDLLECIVEKFKTALTISKLEGDAVFANVDEENIPRPESLLELIETTYVEFRRRRDSSLRATTCACRACQNMATLELKFFVHHGDYMAQQISGIRELVGSDVNLIHRLTKNHIAESTGWKAYVMFTQPALDCIGLQLEGLHAQDETYEHLGTVHIRTFDLLPRYEALIRARNITVPPEESDLTVVYEFDHPIATIWNWITDINCRNAAAGGMATWTGGARNKGRVDVGASNHCAHGKGKSTETIVDWHPFEHTTADMQDGSMQFRECILYAALAENRTRVEVRIQMRAPRPLFITRLMLKREFTKANPYLMWFNRINELLAGDKEIKNLNKDIST
jgi:class 3 adenylate cyclase